jgi:hypothetical protein
MDSKELKDVCIAAINDALVSRGKNKGSLKASRPNSSSDAAAAWEALIMEANPYKAGIWFQVMMNDRQQAIFREVSKAIKGLDLRSIDRDRSILEQLGAW